MNSLILQYFRSAGLPPVILRKATCNGAMIHGRRARRRAGLTLLELVVVVAILAILAGFIIPLAEGYLVSGRLTVAQASLAAVRDAIMGTPDKPGYYADTGQLPSKVADLFVNPFASTDPLYTFNRDTRLGWHGPYLLNPNGAYTVNNSTNFTVTYGSNGDLAVLDPWGHPIVLQFSTLGTADQNSTFVRLISAGRNGVIDTPTDYPSTPTTIYYPPTSARGDDILLFIRHADNSTYP